LAGLTSFAGVARVGPTTASILLTAELPLTVLLAVVLLGERLGAVQSVSGGLVVAAVLVLYVRWWLGRTAPAAPMPARVASCLYLRVTAGRRRPAARRGTRSFGYQPGASGSGPISKRQRGGSARWHRSQTGAPITSLSIVSASRHVSMWPAAAASGQL
jgi:hypothetical protein